MTKKYVNGIIFDDDIQVELIQIAGSDSGIIHAARVSTGEVVNGPEDWEDGEAPGLINYLMSEHHGTPFEHNSITFRVTAPIMVFREWHRHRIQSYNEQSGRYTEFKPHFYIPSLDRPLLNVGSSARPTLVHTDPEIQDEFIKDLMAGYETQWNLYEKAREMDIANEMARLHLSVGIMSTMYATANLRAWLHFLGLRTAESNATNKGRPQFEIVMAAKKVEAILTEHFPITMAKFNEYGRVAP